MLFDALHAHIYVVYGLLRQSKQPANRVHMTRFAGCFDWLICRYDYSQRHGFIFLTFLERERIIKKTATD